MEEIELKIGGADMFISVGDRLKAIIEKTYRRLNYKRQIAQTRHVYFGEIDTPYIVMDSDFVFALEDTLQDDGFSEIFHRQIAGFDSDTSKVLYFIFREDKTIRYLCTVMGKKKAEIEKAIRLLFKQLNEAVTKETV